MHGLVNQVFSISDQPWLLFVIFFAVAAANLFFPPLPLESATVIGGYLSGLGHGSLPVIIVAVSAGMSLSGTILYLLGTRYGKALITETFLSRWVTEAIYQRSLAWFERYGVWTVFVGKLIPGMSFCSILCCGVLRLRPLPALGAICGSNLIFFGILAALGRLFGRNWELVLSQWRRISSWSRLILVIVIGGLVLGFIWQRSKHKLKNS